MSFLYRARPQRKNLRPVNKLKEVLDEDKHVSGYNYVVVSRKKSYQEAFGPEIEEEEISLSDGKTTSELAQRLRRSNTCFTIREIVIPNVPFVREKRMGIEFELRYSRFLTRKFEIKC